MAVAAPIPRDAPVTSAVLPFSSSSNETSRCIILLKTFMKTPATLLFCAVLCFSAAHAAPKTELGDINGAKFRIDVPENWNGGLVIYCHGYNASPVAYKEGKLPPVFEVFTSQGYALAQSGYAAGGWAIQEAV